MSAAIETRYAGCRFRSRLEARWAVFFDRAAIPWQYEPQGFVVGGRPYLPDFLLTECGTWIEVKGDENSLDHDLMTAAATDLPRVRGAAEDGPRLLILGPIPDPPDNGDLGWLGLTPMAASLDGSGDEVFIGDQWWGFASYSKNRRPWALVNTSGSTPYDSGDDRSWLIPAVDLYEEPSANSAYVAARSARFEHGEKG